MKRLYFIGGPMGVGKTAVCRCLQKRLERSVFLDGDWCWDAHPLQVTEETKTMVLDNIAHALNNFLRCSAYDHVFFCWVLHRREIWEELLSRLDTGGCAVVKTALTCSPEALTARVTADVAAGVRAPDATERSLAYLPLYGALGVPLMDTTALTPEETASAILEAAR